MGTKKRTIFQKQIVATKMRTFFYLPNTNSVCLFFPKMTFWQKKTIFLHNHPKTLFFWVLFLKFSFSLFFQIFLFTFSNIKKTKTKSAHFFSRTLFLTTWQIAKKIFSHPYTLFVILNIPKKHYKIGKKNKQKNILDQVLTQPWTKFWLKKPQILDQVLTLQYIYMDATKTH